MKDIVVDTILQIVNKNIDNAGITLDNIEDDLPSIGMDSICFVKIIVSIEEEFECEIPDSKLLISEMNTAKKIIAVLNTLHEDIFDNEQ